MDRRAFLSTALGTLLAADRARAAAGMVVTRPQRRVVMVFAAGGLNDRGFNDAANAGLIRASLTLGVAAQVLNTSADARHGPLLEQALAGHPDLVVAAGFPFSQPAVDVCRSHPGARVAVVDFEPPTKGGALPPGLLGLSFADHQGAFLAGVAAAHLSQSGRVGFVGGMDAPVMRRFAAGFGGGARHARANVVVRQAYAGDSPAGFTRPARGKELALAMFASGVDVLFHASGATGLGIMEAAHEQDKRVIGVDRAFEEAPGIMPAVMVKGVDAAVLASVTAAVAGRFRGGVRNLGLPDDGVDLRFNDREPALASAAVRAAVAKARQALVAGTLTAPQR